MEFRWIIVSWIAIVSLAALIFVAITVLNQQFAEECIAKGGQPILSRGNANNCIIFPPGLLGEGKPR